VHPQSSGLIATAIQAFMMFSRITLGAEAVVAF